jgi:D-arabinose 1-dehydrogenase-like Zn-dependent alcohol dehydrogenase
MPKMRAVQVTRPGQLEMVEREIPQPGAGTVRVKVEACGVCHSDSVVVEGQWPNLLYPRVPGHEIVGVVDAVGSGVTDVSPGRRVGVGWNGGYDGTCEACRRGDFFGCRLQATTGVSSDGGWAEYMIARAEALAMMPDGMTTNGAAPLMCAGVTTFNALRKSGARGGDLVAILGIGGLGHLAVQYAAKMGFDTVAIARGEDKEALAKNLGAARFIDNAAKDVASELLKLGGARVVVATAPSASAMSASLGGLALNGKLLVVGGSSEPLQASTIMLLTRHLSIEGWYSGVSIDVQDTLVFSRDAGIEPMIEVFPLARAAEAYQRMMSGKARFRAVLTMT